jgi:hypothetical protein
MKSKGPKIDPWGIPCVTVSELEKKFGVVLGGFFPLFVYYLKDRIETGLQQLLECHKNVIWPTRFHDLRSQKLLLEHKIFLQHEFFGK